MEDETGNRDEEERESADRARRQTIFDKVWAHFVTNKGAKSTKDMSGYSKYSSEPTCYYRGPNGEKCAFGVLIPDEAYTPSMEGRAAGEVLSKFPRLYDATGLARNDVAFITSLQRAHDETDGGAGWSGGIRSRLILAATDWGLTYPKEE